MSRATLRLYLTVFVAIALSVTGCGKSDGLELGRVNGVILFDGAPLENAKVEFNPVVAAQASKKGQPSSGGSFAITDKDGRYELSFNARRKGAVLGEHSIRITTAAQQYVPDGQLPKPEKVPPRYNIQSQLKFSVDKGKNQADFDLISSQTARR